MKPGFGTIKEMLQNSNFIIQIPRQKKKKEKLRLESSIGLYYVEMNS